MAFLLAAARRAADGRAAAPLLLAAARRTTTTTAYPLLLTPQVSAAATTAYPLLTPQISAASTTDSATPLALTTTAATTAAVTPLLLTTTAATTALLTTTPGISTTATPLTLGAYGLRPIATAILGPRAPTVFSHAPEALHRRFFSTSLLGHRTLLSVPTNLARRGMCSDTLTPAVQRAINQIEKQEAVRHELFLKELAQFEIEVMGIYSAAVLKSAENAFTAGKVAWRVGTAVLAFGIATLVAVLQLIKDGWRVEFQEEVQRMIDEKLEDLKSELLAILRERVKTELELIEAEKVASRK